MGRIVKTSQIFSAVARKECASINFFRRPASNTSETVVWLFIHVRRSEAFP
jgi:hypothetical protein